MKNIFKAPLSVAVLSIFSAFLGAALPANAADGQAGTCLIAPRDLIATWGYSASGTNLQANALIPAGVFSQIGTATGLTATQTGNMISGRWTTTITQNDTSGHLSTVTFSGGYKVDVNTCVGDFSWDSVGVVFRAVFVNHAREFRSVSTLPNVIIAYTNGKKL